MGATSSKSTNNSESYMIDEHIITSFISEYCEISQSNFMDLNTLLFAFLLYAKSAHGLPIPLFMSRKIKKYILTYLAQYGRNKNDTRMFITGYPESRIIVGIKLNSFPHVSDDYLTNLY